ncbi:response regulator [Nitrospira sp. M1]
MDMDGTILLADDEETFAKATKTLLVGEGYQCDTVGDVRELSLALEENDYDLLITDLKMPGNRVMEMVDEIQTRSKILPVIVVTGFPSLASAVDSVRLNVLEYIVKPVDYPRLLQSVRKGIAFKRQLQTVRSVRVLARQRLDELEDIEHALLTFKNIDEAPSIDTMTDESPVSKLQGQLEEVVTYLKTQSTSAGQPQATVPQTAVMSDYFQLREGIYEAIQVLQLTKGSFRSKELANLRLKLQDLLKETSPNP